MRTLTRVFATILLVVATTTHASAPKRGCSSGRKSENSSTCSPGRTAPAGP